MWLRNEIVVPAYIYLHMLPPQIPSYPQTHTDTWNYDQGSAKCTLDFGIAVTIVELGSNKNGKNLIKMKYNLLWYFNEN